MDKSPALLIKERIKNFASQLEKAKQEVEKMRKDAQEKENVGREIVGGLKAMQELLKEFET